MTALRSTLLWLLLLLPTLHLTAQDTPYFFRHFHNASGLSHNTVMCLFQDSKGFLWVGTKHGLNRFDGNGFKMFHRGEGPHDLLNSMIYCLAEAPDGKLWIGTDQGISVYDPQTERFTAFNPRTARGGTVGHYVTRLFIDSQARVWILSTGNVFMYDSSSGELHDLRHEVIQQHSTTYPTALYVEEDGTAYIGLPKVGILRYNPLTGHSTFIGSIDFRPTVIHPYKDKWLLIGSLAQGLYLMRKDGSELRQLDIDPQRKTQVYVRTIEQISPSEYWVGTESGIYVLKDGLTQHLTHDNFNEQTLSDNAIYAICRDTDKGIWIGSYFGGIDYIPRQNSPFVHHYPVPYKNSVGGFRIREFVEDPQGKLWIATEDNGLSHFDPVTGTFTSVTDKTQALRLSYTNVQCLQLKGEELWVGNFTSGIDVLNLKTFTSRHYEALSGPHALRNNDVFAIYTDSRDSTWVGTTTQTYLYDPSIDGFRIFQPLDNAFVSDILEDRHGSLWFATYNEGVIRYRPHTNQIQRFRYDGADTTSLGFDRVTGIFEDSRGRLWFSTEDGGFCRFNAHDETFTRFTTRNGLPSNAVYKILEDQNRHLWISTNNGLAEFDPETGTVTALYNLQNGLRSKQFNYNSGIRTQDGTLYFGSIDGFVAFNPAHFNPQDSRYSVILTDFYLHNQRVIPGDEEGVLPKALPYTSQIQLNHKQNSLGIGFSSLHYSLERIGKYAYMLEGADKQWITTDHTERVSYNSLPYGHYTFRIKYSANGHDWNGPETSLRIQILPPVYKTPWAYTAYGLLLLGLASGAGFTRDKKKRAKARVAIAQQEQQKKEEIYKAKIDFFTNIAHEIRTPVTLIKAPLDTILHTEPNARELKENLHTIERNADRLLLLVNQLLDFRKIESKAFTLLLKEKDVNALVTNTFNRFVPTAERKGLRMELSHPQHSVPAYIDEEAITKVCSNLFNNALKHAAGRIQVILSQPAGTSYVQIAVKNDGEPVPPDLRQRIFEAFFQIKDNAHSYPSGSGIGLTLAASLVQLHNGKLFLDETDEAVSFVVQLPAGSPTTVAPEPIPEPALPHGTDEAETDRPTLLIVEDSEELLLFLTKNLEKSYRVCNARNGAEAMAVLKDQLVNLVVSDVMMPVMDGLELCRQIKADLETCHIPLVLLTAKTNLNNKIEGLKVGADAYIEKPFSLPHLQVQIDNLLSNRKKLRQKFLSSPNLGTMSLAQNKAEEKFLNKLTETIKQNLEDETFNIDILAAQMHMSRTSLHRKIKGLVDLTPGDMIRIIRLKRAAELLQEGNYRINEICMLVGIRSLSYFSKSFQKQFGVLPKDFAKKK